MAHHHKVKWIKICTSGVYGPPVYVSRDMYTIQMGSFDLQHQFGTIRCTFLKIALKLLESGSS